MQNSENSIQEPAFYYLQVFVVWTDMHTLKNKVQINYETIWR
jgi:hypothetical protein